ncbi:hypothetical protein PV10_02079 [Exophiala mesophila]|uniref:Uncharacterized protein n=1 Tax=Exophiala mesophila TaxID=212818 RepID=A0A0D1WXW2_EXOME|nr:uncharacterized protein PV10_02079 [Exophiala mesophila]KIV94300.1 hypothetical protein PV10_02079 [Exophiala mesophila]
MSEISILGFKPTSSSSTLFSSSIHWAVLVEPDYTHCRNPQSKNLALQTRNDTPKSNSTILHIQDHQLRQQPWPIPVEDETESKYDTTITTPRRPSPSPSSIFDTQTSSTRPSSSPASSSLLSTAPTTTTTLNATSQHPLRLSLKICISRQAQRPSKLIPKLLRLLQTTPTYGLEEDWLRSALAFMHVNLGLMEVGFDVDGFIAYASEAVKEYSLYDTTEDYEDGGDEDDVHVLELDYLSFVHRNNQVKALLSQHTQSPRRNHHKRDLYDGHRYDRSPPPRYSASILPLDHEDATPGPPPSSPQNSSSPSLQSNESSGPAGIMRRWVKTMRKFQVSPSPSQVKYRSTVHLQPWQRRDDPYGGLM